MKPKIALTFDIENWSDSKFLNEYLTEKDRQPNQIELSIDLILQLLAKHQAKATFFILGRIAAQFPETIKKIAQAGHEIASHGYSHTTLEKLTPAEFEDEIKKTNKILKSIVNVTPLGFRAPAFSLNRKTIWAQPILKKYGFKYDSSIFPMKMGVYGDNPEILQEENLKEFPVAVYKKLFLKLPLAGGIYFRMFPYRLFRFFLKRCCRKKMPVIYFHNHELIDCRPNIPGCPAWKKWLKFKGVAKNQLKLARLLNDFDCSAIKDSLINP